jgi:hypothetical protein
MEMVVYDAFRKAGVEESQAKVIASEFNTNFNATIHKAIEQSVNPNQLATKGDLEQLRLATQADIEKVRPGLQAEIERSKNDIIKWIFGSIVTAAGLATGIALAIVRLFFTAS